MSNSHSAMPCNADVAAVRSSLFLPSVLADASEEENKEGLGEFSPSFIWLLRDFYLDLEEDDQEVTPRDYLETALR